MQITLERQSKAIALSFNTDNSIAYDELYLAVQDKMSAIVNGGKFFVGKAFTIVGNAVSVLSKNIYVQGLTVAAAGGLLGSRLAGGSFELGFLTAGLAFAVNQVVTELAQEEITTTRTEDSILYERGNSSVLVKNDVPSNGIPQVSEERISHALDVSAQEGGARVNIISGYRGPDHQDASVNHEKYNAIDVYIDGYDSTQTARALYNSGHFHRVAGYPDSNLQSAHGDDRTTRRGGCFVYWGGPGC